MAMDKKDKKIEALKARMKGIGSKIARGGKGTMIAGGVGAGTYYVEKMIDEKWGPKAEKAEDNKLGDNADFIKGGALLVLGHFAKRKQYDAGTGMVGVGGYIAARGLANMKSKDEGTAADKAIADATKASVASGLDAGMMEWTVGDSAGYGGNAGGYPSSAPGSGDSGVSSAPNPPPRQLPARQPSWNVQEASMLVD
jgi:hypothetical protein